MAMTPEGKVKKWLHDRLKTELPNGYKYMPPGGALGKAGVPDVFYLWQGVFIAIETKADVPGAKPTALQMNNLRAIAAAGGVAALLKGRDEAKLQAILTEVRRRANASAI